MSTSVVRPPHSASGTRGRRYRAPPRGRRQAFSYASECPSMAVIGLVGTAIDEPVDFNRTEEGVSSRQFFTIGDTSSAKQTHLVTTCLSKDGPNAKRRHCRNQAAADQR